ncbi:MAG: YfiR family protein [Bacteroidales bacterium]|nr:YfiR family protein [Bacteroidales bacterium]MBN2820344.1 YfiR family protein [Bacteroidales bacterium]
MGSRIVKLLIVCFAFFSNNVWAQTSVDEAQAIFIYNFLSHTLWPETVSNNTIEIGVYGETNTYKTLCDYTQNRKVGTKSIAVKKLNSINEAVNCNVILIAYNSSNQMSQINEKLKNKPCLVITEKAGTTNLGAIIEFTLVNDKLKYRANQENAIDHNLYLSAALLKMSL